MSSSAQNMAVHAFASSHIVVSQIEALTADASARNYWRVSSKNGERFVVMHSPNPGTESEPFITIGQWLHSEGVPVPEIFAQSPSRQYLLLEDFGDLNLYAYLKETESIKTLIRPIDALVGLSYLKKSDTLPLLTKSMLFDETRLFDQWCLETMNLGAKTGDFDPLYTLLADSALAQPQGFVHRDYHSLNIHFCEGKQYGLGLIDFQDAVWGPHSYDLISLLLDRYITWSEDSVNEVIELYRKRIQCVESTLEFRRQVLWLGLQRHIRTLGIFNRLSLRDSKHIYLHYLPRKADYCRSIIERYDELQPLGHELINCFKRAGWF